MIALSMNRTENISDIAKAAGLWRSTVACYKAAQWQANMDRRATLAMTNSWVHGSRAVQTRNWKLAMIQCSWF